VALGLTITVCAAFVVGSLLRAIGTDIGYATEHLVVIEAQYPPAFKLTHSDAERLKRLDLLRSIVAPALDDMLVRVRALPGVIAVGASHGTILRRRGIGSGFGDNFAITDGFVEALQPRLVRGRWPTRDEISAGTPVAVISEDIARRFVSGPPLGQTIRNYADGSSMLEVIGVSEEARYRSWDAKGQQGQVFSPYRTTAFDATVTVLVRVTNPRDVFAWATREAAVPAGVLRLSAATQADDLLRDTIRARRFQASVFGTICTASLVIVGIGILGLTAMTSARRRREIGIRLALGATRRRVVVQLCREQFGATAVGLLAGLVAGFGATIVVARSYVYGTPPWSVEVWLAAVATIVLTASIGMIIPARRASRVDPVVVLRCD
jgi:ABC-type antimicrobial peptide transport system permease subunit